MSPDTAILLTLVAYQVLLVGIGLWAAGQTHDNADFFLGGRRLGPWVAALSASASSSSAWTLLGVSGAAFAWGLPAVWLLPATLSGFLINWCWVAPRLRRISAATGSLTLTELIASGADRRWRPAIVRVASGAVAIAFLFYIAAQFQAAGHAFSATFGWSPHHSIAAGAAVVVFYTLIGGFWAVSVTDTVQGTLMAVAAVVLPAAAVVAAGGLSPVAAAALPHDAGSALALTGEAAPLAGLAFVLGTLGIGLGYPGQPHVVNRFMALRDERALARGRVIAILWALAIYSGMLLVGWSARVLFSAMPDGEQVLFHAAKALLPPVAAGLMVAAVLSAIMSTADSQLLVVSSSLAWDLRGGSAAGPTPLGRTRAVVSAVSALAVVLAVASPATIFARVLFAWHALGSAFGPVLVLRLAGRQTDGRAIVASIASGFALTVLFFWLPDTPGDWAERLIPLAAAFVIAAAWSRRPA